MVYYSYIASQCHSGEETSTSTGELALLLYVGKTLLSLTCLVGIPVDGRRTSLGLWTAIL